MNLCIKVHASLKEDALGPTVDLLREDSRSHVCVFVNFFAEAGKISGTLEDFLAEDLLCIDVLSINSAMDKNKKNAFIRLFTSVLWMEGHTFCVLVAIAAANKDQPLCFYVLCVGIPWCTITLLQECGCLVRRRHDGHLFIVLFLGSMDSSLTERDGARGGLLW